MKMIKKFFDLRILAILLAATFVVSCSKDEEPAPVENLPEVFTNVTLTFTPEGGGTAVTATAEDPDGEGPSDLVVADTINLAANTTYKLTFNIENRLDPAADLNAEILEEDNEHQIFFSFTDGVFTSPTGSGNIGADNAANPINYLDKDENGNSLGLQTSWTTGDAVSGAQFTTNLQHQPEIKSSTSTSADGDTDFLLQFTLNIK